MSGQSAGSVVNATVVDSVFASNIGQGLLVITSTGTADLMVLRSVVAYNAISTALAGIQAGGANSTVRIAQSAITENGTGWSNDGTATVLSYGDNYIDGNRFGNTPPPLTARK
jgi:hypothetical protein